MFSVLDMINKVQRMYEKLTCIQYKLFSFLCSSEVNTWLYYLLVLRYFHLGKIIRTYDDHINSSLLIMICMIRLRIFCMRDSFK